MFILSLSISLSRSLSQISPGHYGNTGLCQDVGSLGVGVQLRPPPVVHPPPASHPPTGAPSLRPDLFFCKPSEEWLTTPVSKQAKNRAAVNDYRPCLNRCLSSPHTHRDTDTRTESSHAAPAAAASFLLAFHTKDRICGAWEVAWNHALTSGSTKSDARLTADLFKQFHTVCADGFEYALLQEKSIKWKFVAGQSCESLACIPFEWAALRTVKPERERWGGYKREAFPWSWKVVTEWIDISGESSFNKPLLWPFQQSKHVVLCCVKPSTTGLNQCFVCETFCSHLLLSN